MFQSTNFTEASESYETLERLMEIATMVHGGAMDDIKDPDALRRELDDQGVLAVIAKQAKQRQDSIEEFNKASRTDLADKDAAELKILETYLPAMLSRDEIAAAAREVIAETGASGPADKGKVMPVIMKRLAGQADGRAINEVVTELLAGG